MEVTVLSLKLGGALLLVVDYTTKEGHFLDAADVGEVLLDLALAINARKVLVFIAAGVHREKRACAYSLFSCRRLSL